MTSQCILIYKMYFDLQMAVIFSQNSKGCKLGKYNNKIKCILFTIGAVYSVQLLQAQTSKFSSSAKALNVSSS